MSAYLYGTFASATYRIGNTIYNTYTYARARREEAIEQISVVSRGFQEMTTPIGMRSQWRQKKRAIETRYVERTRAIYSPAS